MAKADFVWVFQGESAQFPSAVFSTQQQAAYWISTHHLSGILTQYPVDVSVYDWSIHHEFFSPKRDQQRTPEFIARFSSAALQHVHFLEGRAKT